ncbi:MAG: saccharopine dehydrogenase NADP-binding domain-containing protein [Myxococcota bacterium]
MRHDIVLWGATGFTGQLVAAYLARHEGVGRGLTWALAGRDAAKVAKVREQLAEVDPAARTLPMILANATDPASMRALAAQAKVVCTTVGPYARYGAALVDACVAEGTHYVDLTGEPTFVHRMIAQHHDEARRRGVAIVHGCGFDSIPSDLGCLLVQEHARRRWGSVLPEVTLYVNKMRGAASGGTIASMAELIAEASEDPAAARVLRDPYSLGGSGPPVNDGAGPAWDADEGVWTAPFLMAATNARLVRRSAALLGYDPFRYAERQRFAGNPLGWAGATSVAAALGAGVVVLRAPRVRQVLLDRVLPAPGTGPSAAARAAGFFEMESVGRGPDGRWVRVTVRGDQDPGYGATSGMLAEAALCLLRSPRPDGVGVVTPAVALGEPLVARLARAGVTFEVRESA